MLAADPAEADNKTLTGHVPPAISEFNLHPVGPLQATSHLKLTAVLPPRNMPALQELLHEIENPRSTNFHHYLTPEQFDDRFGPTAADYSTVIKFATTNGWTVTGTVPGRSLVKVDATVADIERALHVHMLQYQHPTEARTFFAPDVEPSLDASIPILCFSGLNDYILPSPKYHLIPASEMSEAPRNGSYPYPGGGTLYMGSDFRHAYALGTTLTGSGQSVGVVELDGYTPDDITAYESTAGLPPVAVQEVLLDSLTNNPDNGDAEPPLDVEMAISMAPGISKVVFYRALASDVDGLLTEIAEPTQGEPRPSQIGCSWGYTTDSGTSNALMRLAMQGQAYLYAIGDEGAVPVYPNGPGGTYTRGAWPSDIEPYMTDVGGTDLNMNGTGASWASETVWPGSAGGILTTVPIPFYQEPINMSAVGGSNTHCNVPDVAMAANYILVVVTGTNGVQNYSPVSGTSCAAPLWAGFTALADQQSAAEGKPAVGFLTPAIYGICEGPLYASCFNDIISGNNTNSASPTEYFAEPGYDLCTGWGTPQVNLINALVEFGTPMFVDFNYTGSIQNGTYLYPFKTLAQGVSAVSNNGTIFIITGGSSSETMTMSKPMNISAIDGAATVGN
ncbi:MAG TPA: S53 family serine peptidase [Alphaproteobacteria bacterium]|nr:S53 family serine peptidase [Alphaproteobacteria bacterium]